MKHPKWILNFLTEKEIAEVANAVKLAEAKTSGEIVPVIVQKSSDTYWVPFTLTLLLLLMFYGFGGYSTLDHELQLRASSAFAHWGIYFLLGVIAAILFGLSWVLSTFPFVQRAFVPATIQMAEVERRAFLEFYSNHVANTQYQTGILIFISLMERKTVVLGDKHIASKLPPGTWDDIVQTIVESVKAGKTAEGLKYAIETCGNKLSEHFPAHHENIDELPNHLIIKN